MKKIISMLLALTLLLTLAACGSKQAEEPVRHTVRIGVLEPLTGTKAPEGRRELLGVRYAQSLTPSLSLAKEDYDMELVVADCGSTVQSALEAAAYLVEQGVCVVIGAYDSDLSLAVGPLFEENGIALIGVGCTGDALTGMGNYAFRLCLTEEQEVRALADLIWERSGGASLYLMSQEDGEWSEQAARLRSAYEDLGGTVVQDAVRTDTEDLSVYFQRSEAFRCHAVYLALSPAMTALAAHQADAMGFTLPVYANHRIDDPRIPAAMSGNALRLYATVYCRIPDGGKYAEGLRAYLEADMEALQLNGGFLEACTLTALAGDAYDLVMETMRSAQSADKADLLARLPAVSWRGTSGLIRFDDSGAAKWESIWLRRADGGSGVWRMDGSFPLESAQ